MEVGKVSEYQDYLNTLQAKLQTPEEIIRETISKVTGHKMLEKERIIAGEANEVYKVTLGDKKAVFLRISRNNRREFESEKWAIEQVKKLGVPVPVVIGIDYVISGEEKLELCVQEEMPGEVLKRGKIDFSSFGVDRQRNLINQAGEILSKIHSVKIDGFESINELGKGKYQSFADVIKFSIDCASNLSKLVNPVLLEKAVFTLDKRAGNLLCASPVLNHGDYGHKHFMYNDDKIVGILDWGEVGGFFPAYEFARWDYWYGSHIPTEWLIEGYVDRSIFGPDWQEQLRYLRILKGFEVIGCYLENSYPKAVDTALEKLKGDVEYFS